ncbi:MAG TPA: hypothetical protein VMQ76_13270 [Terracidiphilus sp.]|nr:hypothetical protein [Terracidiphilus sp.]
MTRLSLQLRRPTAAEALEAARPGLSRNAGQQPMPVQPFEPAPGDRAEAGFWAWEPISTNK